MYCVDVVKFTENAATGRKRPKWVSMGAQPRNMTKGEKQILVTKEKRGAADQERNQVNRQNFKKIQEFKNSRIHATTGVW